MDQSRFIRGLLSDPVDPQLPQYVPENDFGPRAFGLLNSLFPDPYEATGDAIRQYRGGDAIGAFETMFGAMPTTGALKAAKAGKAANLPMDEASRLTRAAEQGFTIDAYKGSPAYSGGPVRNWRGETIEDAPFNLISEFNSPEKPYAGFFTDSPDVASKFADVFGSRANEWGASVFPTKLRMQNPLVIDGKNKPAAAFQFESIAREHGTHDNLEAFQKAFAPDSNYDGLIVKNTLDEGTVYIPRAPNQIRSRFAAFDPSKADSKNIMAALIGLLGGGGATAAGGGINSQQAAPGL